MRRSVATVPLPGLSLAGEALHGFHECAPRREAPAVSSLSRTVTDRPRLSRIVTALGCPFVAGSLHLRCTLRCGFIGGWMAPGCRSVSVTSPALRSEDSASRPTDAHPARDLLEVYQCLYKDQAPC